MEASTICHWQCQCVVGGVGGGAEAGGGGASTCTVGAIGSTGGGSICGVPSTLDHVAGPCWQCGV